ncbi:MAG: winged helix-turn-helix transcriptional regulator [Planctomycetales bacterium]|nr:winged helix-turn-helix transcriptional regulator [Planctomycetales bacterium]
MLVEPHPVANQPDSLPSEYCAERLKALSDPLRLRIVRCLRHGELTVSDIALVLESEVVTVSHHLQTLKNAQLVSRRREGRFIYYRLPAGLSTSRKTVQSLDLGCCKLAIPI